MYKFYFRQFHVHYVDGDKGLDQIEELLASNILSKSVHDQYRFPIISPADIKQVITYFFGRVFICLYEFISYVEVFVTKQIFFRTNYFHWDLDY